MSKHHEAGVLGTGLGAGWGDLDWARAEAREKGRATPRLLYWSERGLAMRERRVADLLDLGGGERPAGLRIGADLGVAVEEIFKGVEIRGEMLVLRVERAMRDVLMGLVMLLFSSSSSDVRLRFVERLAGLIFSVSVSMKIELFIGVMELFVDMPLGCELGYLGNIKTRVITYRFAGSGG